MEEENKEVPTLGQTFVNVTKQVIEDTVTPTLKKLTEIYNNALTTMGEQISTINKNIEDLKKVITPEVKIEKELLGNDGILLFANEVKRDNTTGIISYTTGVTKPVIPEGYTPLIEPSIAKFGTYLGYEWDNKLVLKFRGFRGLYPFKEGDMIGILKYVKSIIFYES